MPAAALVIALLQSAVSSYNRRSLHLLTLSAPALSMLAAGLALLIIGLLAAKKYTEKIVALTHLCFAVPLAVFGAEHLSIAQSMTSMVPSYMPVRLFWVYLVGLGLIAASLSIATGRLVRLSGLLFGTMMFLFVAMIHLPGALHAGGRFPWTIVFREMCFGGAGFVLAGIALGRLPIAAAAIFFGIEHFLHPLGLPGVPLAKEIPAWIPARALIDYVTGALLIVAGLAFLLRRKSRMAATCVGAWIVLLVIVIYSPVLVNALRNSSPGIQIEGINYFADTLLFGAAILSVAAGNRK